MEVDIEDRRRTSVAVADDVRVPDLVQERPGCSRGVHAASSAARGGGDGRNVRAERRFDRVGARGLAGGLDTAAADPDDHFGQGILAGGDSAGVEFEELEIEPQGLVGGLEGGVEGAVPHGGRRSAMPVHLDLDGGGGEDRVAREGLVAHEAGPALGSMGREGEQVVVVDELAAIGQLFHRGRDPLELVGIGGETRPRRRDSTAWRPECFPSTRLESATPTLDGVMISYVSGFASMPC